MNSEQEVTPTETVSDPEEDVLQGRGRGKGVGGGGGEEEGRIKRQKRDDSLDRETTQVTIGIDGEKCSVYFNLLSALNYVQL